MNWNLYNAKSENEGDLTEETKPTQKWSEPTGWVGVIGKEAVYKHQENAEE